jgi:hypothetical protein
MLLYVDSNFASPYALVAFVSLLEKGLPFDVKPLELFSNAQKNPTSPRLRSPGESRRSCTTALRCQSPRQSANTSMRPFQAHASTPLIRGIAPERAKSRRGCAAISCRFAKSGRHSLSSVAPRDPLFHRKRLKQLTSYFPLRFNCSKIVLTIYLAIGQSPTSI